MHLRQKQILAKKITLYAIDAYSKGIYSIDTLGNVIYGSGIIEASTDERYSQVVCQALPHLKFAPVVIDGRKTVAGLVHVPFAFEIN